MNDDVCVGGDCAKTCPIYQLGAPCMSPVELYRWHLENRASLTLEDALVH